MRFKWQSRVPSGIRFFAVLEASQPPISRLKFALTRRLAGFRAATIERSMATPDSKDGARPAKISGQNLSADCITEICADIAPSATAASFSEPRRWFPSARPRRAASRSP